MLPRLRSPIPLLVVVGPTASGKTALALRLAEVHNAEVITCDALQVRAGLPLLTAKPTVDEQMRVPHHLVGVFPTDQPATAAAYAELADQAILKLHKEGKNAILCGGTGLYLRAVCEGLVATPPSNPVWRSELSKKAHKIGVEALHAELQQVDPDTAARLGKTDYVRIERALEVCALTGKPLSVWHKEHQAERVRGPRYRSVRIGLDPGSPETRDRIAARVEKWLEEGLLEEVRLHLEHAGEMRFPPIGFAQVARFLRTETTREAMIAEIVQKTAQYARRQRTWFRAEKDISWYRDEKQVPQKEYLSAAPNT